MTRILAGLAVALGVCSAAGQSAAPGGALATAAQQETNEKVRRLQAELEDMKALVSALNRRVEQLSRQLQTQDAALRRALESMGQSQTDKASRSEVEALSRALREVEANRKADQAQVVKGFSELRKLILDVSSRKQAAAAPPPRRKSPPPEGPKGTYHTVEKGQTLFAILAAYQEALKAEGSKYRLTLDKLKKANPKLDPDRLLVGQKLFIPLED